MGKILWLYYIIVIIIIYYINLGFNHLRESNYSKYSDVYKNKNSELIWLLFVKLFVNIV